MPRAQQRVMSEERPVRQYRSGEGTLIALEEIEQFLTLYKSLNRTEGTVKFYQRKLARLY